MYESFEMPYAEHIAWPPGATDGCLIGIKPGTRLRMQHQHMRCWMLTASLASGVSYWMRSPRRSDY